MLSKGLAEYAAANGIGTLGVDLFAKEMQETPDPGNAICVYDETGPTLPVQQDYDVDVFGSQWLVRGAPSFVIEKCLAIHRLIPGLGNTELDGIGIVSTQVLSVPSDIGNDEKGREQYSIHYLHEANIGSSDHRLSLVDPLPEYKQRVIEDGGEIINEDETRAMLVFLRNENLHGTVVSPWAGVKLRSSGGSDYVEKAYSLCAYTSTPLDFVQNTEASQPEQIGETWSFDGIDDFLTADLEDNPTQFTAFSKIANYSSGTTDTIISTMIESWSVGSRWHLTKFGNDNVSISTFTGSGEASSTDTAHDGNNYIATVANDTVEIYKDGESIGDNTNESINSGGNTEIRIGARNNSTRFFPSTIEGATGIITSVLTLNQIKSLNSKQ